MAGVLVWASWVLCSGSQAEIKVWGRTVILCKALESHSSSPAVGRIQVPVVTVLKALLSCWLVTRDHFQLLEAAIRSLPGGSLYR